jgi:hypothetical protein
LDASFTKVGPLENRTFPGEKRTIPPFRRRAGKPGDNRTVPIFLPEPGQGTINSQIRSGGTIKKKMKVTRAVLKALLRTFFLSTKCLEYSVYVMAKATAAAQRTNALRPA